MFGADGATASSFWRSKPFFWKICDRNGRFKNSRTDGSEQKNIRRCLEISFSQLLLSGRRGHRDFSRNRPFADRLLVFGKKKSHIALWTIWLTSRFCVCFGIVKQSFLSIYKLAKQCHFRLLLVSIRQQHVPPTPPERVSVGEDMMIQGAAVQFVTLCSTPGLSKLGSYIQLVKNRQKKGPISRLKAKLLIRSMLIHDEKLLLAAFTSETRPTWLKKFRLSWSFWKTDRWDRLCSSQP